MALAKVLGVCSLLLRVLGDLPYLIGKLDVLVPPQDVLVPIQSAETQVLNNSLWYSQSISRVR